MLYAIMASLAGSRGERQPKCDGFDMIKPSFHSLLYPAGFGALLAFCQSRLFNMACLRVFSLSICLGFCARGLWISAYAQLLRMDPILSDRRGFQKFFIAPEQPGHSRDSRLLKLYRGLGSGVWQNWEWSGAGKAR